MEKNAKMSRRNFVKNSLMGGGTLSMVGFGHGIANPKLDIHQVPKKTLGRTGVEVSLLGIGSGAFRQEYIDAKYVKELIYRALDMGVNYIDTAPNYGNTKVGYSEEKLGPVIKEIRDKVFLVTKTEDPTYEGTWKLLHQSMKRMNTDYLDLVHIHNFGHRDRFPDTDFTLGDQGSLGALRAARKQGVVRFIGGSGHLYPSRFHKVLDTGEIDVVMNAVNFIVQHTYDFEHKVWSRAREENVGLVAMKVLGGQSGRKNPVHKIPEKYYKKAIQYALSIPDLSSAVIGLKNIEELERAAKTITLANPLTNAERVKLAAQGLELANQSKWETAYGNPLT